MKKILMVCLGNICRSPLAEGILQSKVSTNIEIDSAGTGAYHVGSLPDPRSIDIARKYGLDITNQRARKFTREDFSDFDLIFAMDENNYDNLIMLASNESEKNKVRMILNEVHPKKNLSVPDPYYGGKDGFKNVYEMLDEACDAVVKKYKL